MANQISQFQINFSNDFKFKKEEMKLTQMQNSIQKCMFGIKMFKSYQLDM